ncbi:hypothetical protein HGRIS_009522 [Hohenbuehelia grisea]|uniref:GmrSD restriction endonucleases N-terminal domain-containing protein n=1 Tax=Hohenbuehelia grisea TaxID=104357 RepID=A0ABR3J1K2_9AGAR
MMNPAFGPGQVAAFPTLPSPSQPSSSQQHSPSLQSFSNLNALSQSQYPPSPYPRMPVPSGSQYHPESSNTSQETGVSQPTITAMKVEPMEVDELSDGAFSEDEDDDDPNVFRVRFPLKTPSYKIYTTSELHRSIHQANIDLNPPYQRDVVWSEPKQICLIDSIFRNFYIPPVVFAITREPDGSVVKICVDGKQRLTSIQKFLDGQIPHKDIATKKSFWYTVSAQQKGNKLEIPEKWKREFASKQITCVEYEALDESLEREIFQRVQLGVTLTSAEKLQAVSSKWAVWLGDLLQRHVHVDGGLMEVLQWNTDRGRDYQNMACVLYLCESYPEQAMPTAAKLEKFLSRSDSPTPQFKTDINGVFDILNHIATTPPLNNGFKKIIQKLAPVEFMFIGALLYATRDGELEDRAEAIFHMRKSIRQQFKDIRFNSNVCRVLWKFIGDLENDPTGAGTGTSSGRRRKEVEPAVSSSGKKRGRPREQDDDYSPSSRRTGPGASRGRGRGRA